MPGTASALLPQRWSWCIAALHPQPGAVRVSGGPEDSVMVYALRAPGELRVVLVHKRGKPEGPLTAQVTISGERSPGTDVFTQAASACGSNRHRAARGPGNLDGWRCHKSCGLVRVMCGASWRCCASAGPNDWGVASVERLVADGLTSTAPGITVAGYTVDAATGRLRQAAGVQASCKVKPTLQVCWCSVSVEWC